jgi:hypothetical protein
MEKLIALKDIYVFYNKKFIHIDSHPYYKALYYNDQRIYNDFIQHSSYQSSKPTTGTWEGFYALYEKIKTEGLKKMKRDPIVIIKKDGKFVCIHGRHRICMLRMIYCRYDEVPVAVIKKKQSNEHPIS